VPLANSSFAVTPGSGASVAAHAVGGVKLLAMVRTDNSGLIIDDPTDVYCAAVRIAPTAQPTHLLSLMNTHASLIVDVLAVHITSMIDESTFGVQSRERLRRITAHSNGAAVTPVKLDTASGALDAAITMRKFTGSLTCTVTGEAFASGMSYPYQPGSGQYAYRARHWLWNYANDGLAIPCRQNEGIAISSPADTNAYDDEFYVGMMFRVR